MKRGWHRSTVAGPQSPTTMLCVSDGAAADSWLWVIAVRAGTSHCLAVRAPPTNPWFSHLFVQRPSQHGRQKVLSQSQPAVCRCTVRHIALWWAASPRLSAAPPPWTREGGQVVGGVVKQPPDQKRPPTTMLCVSSSPQTEEATKALVKDYWDCSVCTFKNSAEVFKCLCLMCDHVHKGTSTP